MLCSVFFWEDDKMVGENVISNLKTTKNHKIRTKTPTKATKIVLNYVDTAEGMTYNEHRKLCHGTAQDMSFMPELP